MTEVFQSLKDKIILIGTKRNGYIAAVISIVLLLVLIISTTNVSIKNENEQALSKSGKYINLYKYLVLYHLPKYTHLFGEMRPNLRSHVC